MNRLSSMLRHPLAWPCLTLVLLVMLDLAHNPAFLSISVLDGHLFGAPIDILNRAAPLVLVSLGMTLVIATRGIDISVGAVVAIAGAAAASILAADPSQVGMAILAALAAGLLAGMWNGLLVAIVGMQPIIATLILMVAGRGVAQLLTGGQIIPIGARNYLLLGGGYLALIPCSMWIAAAAIAVTTLLMNRTALGLFIRAIGINPVATRLAGLRSSAIVFGVYTFSGLTAAIAGILASSNVRSADGNNAGLLLELDAILAVTLGGTSLLGGRFSLAGTVLGALIIQTLTYTTYSIGVPPEATLVVKAAVVLMVSVIQSTSARAFIARQVRRAFPAATKRTMTEGAQ
ncbi:sugar ABC transporter permease [Caballeronia arationis]|jgi:simple sugar transport system permease protein|uniref:Monosaccharide ABC transporter membrane protein, CUT2 family n=1 Tax=Caballeronia arationis TaxID=1777142 RepID=A0A7Z7I4K6_9BURK|nr:ABC transporter permease [Caballeronia arationis]SAK98987.1 sugar ABC transporter permease [Caballeronia arationis]SOE62150.1 monosaccharide ABC transporter membrane protein, CUT2 family [Caballeronia arationis]